MPSPKPPPPPTIEQFVIRTKPDGGFLYPMACNTSDSYDALYRTDTFEDARQMCARQRAFPTPCRFVVLPLTSSDAYQLRSTAQCTLIRLDDTLDKSYPFRIVAMHTPTSPPETTPVHPATIMAPTCRDATFWERCWDQGGSSDAHEYSCATACAKEINAFYQWTRDGANYFRTINGQAQCLCDAIQHVDMNGMRDLEADTTSNQREWFSVSEFARLFNHQRRLDEQKPTHEPPLTPSHTTRLDHLTVELRKRSKELCMALSEDVRRRETDEAFDIGFHMHTLLPPVMVLYAHIPNAHAGCTPCPMTGYDGPDCDRFFEAIAQTMRRHRIVTTPLRRPPTYPSFEYKRDDDTWSADPPSQEELTRRIGDHLDTVCCVVARTEQGRRVLGNATKDCHRRHCFDDMQRTGLAAAGRRLRYDLENAPKTIKQPPRSSRRLDDKGRALALRPHEHVAIDLLNDHSHPIEGCTHVLTHRVRSGVPHDATHFNEAECALRHVAHRVAEYHEVDVTKVQSVFDTMGKTSIEVFARFASMGVASSPHARETTAREAAQHAREQELREELQRGAERAFGRRMDEEEEPVEEAHDPLPLFTTDEGIDVSYVARDSRDMHEFAEESRLFQREMHDRSRAHTRETSNALRRRNATAFEYGAREHASSSITSTITREIEQTTTLASFVIGSDGSITRRARTITERAKHSVKHVREVRRLVQQSADKEHGRLFERHAPHASSDIPHVATIEEFEIARTHHRRLAELRNHSTRRVLSRFLEDNLFVDRLRVQDIPRSSMHRRIVDDVDWLAIADTVRSAAHSERNRMRWWSRGRVDEEAPPNEGVAAALGLEYLAPTAMGRALRTLGYVMRHGHPPDWEEPLHEVVSQHRRRRLEEEPFATRSVMDGRWRSGPIRRLTEDFGTGLFDGTLLVPHSQTSERIQNTTAGFIEEIGSYMIYNVFLVSRPTFPPCSHPHT